MLISQGYTIHVFFCILERLKLEKENNNENGDVYRKPVFGKINFVFLM